LLAHANQLYEDLTARRKPLEICALGVVFTIEDVVNCIKKLAPGKEIDLEGLQAEHLKWGIECFSGHIKNLSNQIVWEGFLEEWMTSLILLIF
jgi:hypothetical protein